MPLYMQIALGIVLSVLLLAVISMVGRVFDRVIGGTVQLLRDVIRALEHIITAPFRAISR